MFIIVAIALLVTGSVALTYGLRGRRIGLRPRCRKCSYDLASIPNATTCPECGQSLIDSVSVNRMSTIHLRRHRIAAAAGIISTCFSLLLFATVATKVSPFSALPLRAMLFLADTPVSQLADFDREMIARLRDAQSTREGRKRLVEWITSGSFGTYRSYSLSAISVSGELTNEQYSAIANWAAQQMMLCKAESSARALCDALTQAMRLGGTIDSTLLRDVAVKCVRPTILLFVPEWDRVHAVAAVGYRPGTLMQLPIDVIITRVQCEGSRLLWMQNNPVWSYSAASIALVDQLGTSQSLRVTLAFRFENTSALSSPVALSIDVPGANHQSEDNYEFNAYSQLASDQLMCSVGGPSRVPVNVRVIRGASQVSADALLTSNLLGSHTEDWNLTDRRMPNLLAQVVAGAKPDGSLVLQSYATHRNNKYDAKYHAIEAIPQHAIDALTELCALRGGDGNETRDLGAMSTSLERYTVLQLVGLWSPKGGILRCHNGPAIKWLVIEAKDVEPFK